jgi:site-specific DNA-methyltransferase (adenine-specific)
MAMAEQAWTNIPGNAKIIECVSKDKSRFHPTQKPVYLYKKLLEWYAKPGDKILDTHLGSGSIAIACIDMGFDLWGSELDADYFSAMQKRIAEHKAQPEMFKPQEMTARELFA